MSSLKDAVVDALSAHDAFHPILRTQNNHDMSVTPPVSHVEMCPYVASADVAFESHAETAVLMFRWSSVQSHARPACRTPHDVDAHRVSSNAGQVHVVVHAPAEVLVEGRGVYEHPLAWS